MVFEIMFVVVFPLVLVGIIIYLFIHGSSNKSPEREYMTNDEFLKDWLKDHGQGHKLEEQFAKMQKDPAGKIYMPWTYKGAKFCIKRGLTPNNVSIINLVLSFLIFWGVIMASSGHSLDLLTVQPFYGWWFLPLGFLVLFTGVVDGIDGAIARLQEAQTRSGGWFDNVIDRISDILMLVCLLPFNMLVLADTGLDFAWMVWTNIFLIFIYEYMRARHEGLGLKETKPNIGERITRIMTTWVFFLIYGISSFTLMLTNLISPAATPMWAVSHGGITTWAMLIFQISILMIMLISCYGLAKYSWTNLKLMDKKDQTEHNNITK